MSNYKHFSKMYILVRVIALLFHCALSDWSAFPRRCVFRTKFEKFSGESQSKSLCTSDSNIEIFPWLSNIYRWRIYLWNISNASATLIDIPLENAINMCSVWTAWFQFWGKRHHLHIDVLFFPQYFECAAPHRVGSTGQDIKSIKMQQHLVITFCVPSCLTYTKN